MTINYRHGVSLVELVVYIPTLFIALWMAFRHGFSKSSGWVSFVVFSLARVIGSICYLATISNPTTKNLYIAWAVCSAVGLSPLTMALVGLLSRANDSIKRKTGQEYNAIIFKLSSGITLIGAILCIIGSTSNYSDPSQGVANTKTKIGLVIFVIAWIALCVLLVMVGSRSSSIEDGEHRLLVAVAISIPLLFVRLVYSLLTVFAKSSTFNLLNGNVTIMLVMSVVEEILIALVCLGIGLTLQVRPNVNAYELDPTMPVDPYEPYGQRLFDEPAKYAPQNAPYVPPPQRRQKRRRRGGPITQLVGLAMDSMESRRH